MKKQLLSVIMSVCLLLGMAVVSGDAVKADDIPAYYSSVDLGYVTPVRDQGEYGTCWSFATLAAVETNLVKQGIADQSIDFSESALAYFMFHNEVDPLGLTYGDTTKAKKYDWLDEGGYNQWSLYILAMNQGLVYEADAPYSEVTRDTQYDSSLAYYNTPYTVKNVVYADIQDRETIKQMVMDYGSVVMAYRMNQEMCFNEEQDAYYWDGSDSCNATGHASIIVGWDDNYSASNFRADMRPSSDGAWLVKNSWGEWNGSGYFWLSYETVTQDLVDYWAQPCVAFEMGLREYDNTYQYDGTCGASGYSEGSYNANIYRAVGDEELNAVGISFDEIFVEYEVSVYTGLADVSKPTSGTLAAKTKGKTRYKGYTVVEIDPVTLTSGEAFAVVVHATSGGNPCAVVSETTSVFPCMDIIASCLPGQSLYSNGLTADWQESDYNYRLKAYTRNLSDQRERPQTISTDDGYNYNYDSLSGEYWLVSYTGTGTELTLQGKINGYPVGGVMAGAFEGDKRIKKVTLDGVKYVGDSSFKQSAVEEVSIRNAVDIGIMAFQESPLKKVYLENVSGVIYYGSFSGCPELTEITLEGDFGTFDPFCMAGDAITKIDFPNAYHIESPFSWGDPIEEIVISGTVEELYLSVLCTLGYPIDTKSNPVNGRIDDLTLALKKLTVTGEVKYFGEALFKIPNDTLDTEKVMELVEQVEITMPSITDGKVYYDFYGNRYVATVIPGTVGESLVIDLSGDEIAEAAYSCLYGVKEVTITESEGYSASRKIDLAAMPDLEKITIDTNTEVVLYGATPNLKEIVFLRDDAKFIHTYGIEVETSFTDKFGHKEHMVTVYAAEGSTGQAYAEKCYYSFYNTTTNELTERKVKVDGRYIKSDDGKVLLGCLHSDGESTRKETVPAGTEIIGPGVYSFYYDPSGHENYSVSEYTIPDSVRVIQDGAFSGNWQYCKYHFGNGIEYIGDNAFAWCGDLGDVYFEKLTHLGANAFHATYIDHLVIPASYSDVLDHNAFDGSRIKNVVFEGPVNVDTSYPLFYMAWDNPYTLTFLDAVTIVKGFGPILLEGSYTEVSSPYRDHLYYNAMFYSLNYVGDEASLQEMTPPLDGDHLVKLYNKAREMYDSYNIMEYFGLDYSSTDEEIDNYNIDEAVNNFYGVDYAFGDEEPDVSRRDRMENIVLIIVQLVVIVAVLAGIVIGIIVIVKKAKKKKAAKSETEQK